MRERPPTALKLIFKVPTLIYRVGLGRLLGRRFLLLVHRGRKSGLERKSVLEVIRYEADPPAAAVLSGWGERSQWFRNLRAAPPVAVEIGGERWLEPQWEVLEPDQVVEAVEEYRRNHRLLMSSLDRFFGWPQNASEEERRRLTRDLCVVVFRPGIVGGAEPAAGARSRREPGVVKPTDPPVRLKKKAHWGRERPSGCSVADRSAGPAGSGSTAETGDRQAKVPGAPASRLISKLK